MKKLSNRLELTLYYNSINPIHKPLPYNKVTVTQDVPERMNGKAGGTGESFGEGATSRCSKNIGFGSNDGAGYGDGCGIGSGMGDGFSDGVGNGFGNGVGDGMGRGIGYGFGDGLVVQRGFGNTYGRDSKD